MRPTDAQNAILLELAAEMARESSHRGWRDRMADGGSAGFLAALDAVLAAEDAWSGLDLALDRDLVPFGLDPLALPALERLTSTAMPPDAARLVPLVTSSTGKRRALLAALLVARAPDALLPELESALNAHAEDLELELLLGLTLPAERRALLAAIERARARRASMAEALSARTTAATRWRDAWGLPAQPFQVRVQCRDVSRANRKASHLREQTSHLDVEIGHRPVRGPELDVAWAVRLRAGGGEPRFGFTPARWSGDILATMVQLDEVVGTFREASSSPLRKGRSVELRGTLETIPNLVREIEAVTQRSFHVGEALIVASLGDALDDTLAERVRAWLVAPPTSRS